jgi:TolB-like protein
VKNHTPMYFCDGLVDDIRTSLSKLTTGDRAILALSKGRSVDVRDAAKQLGVQSAFAIEGLL